MSRSAGPSTSPNTGGQQYAASINIWTYRVTLGTVLAHFVSLGTDLDIAIKFMDR
jgi:hypothetical protein